MGRKRKKKKIQAWKVLATICVVFLGFVSSLELLGTFGVATSSNDISTIEQTNVKREEFIKTIAPHAKLLGDSYGVMPSIIMAQAILESDFGQSQLAKKYNNLFGVKAYGNAPKIKLATKEYVNNQWITIKGDFRVYKSWNESMDAHTQLFINGVDWNPSLYTKVFTAHTYKEAAQAIQDAGYATDPDYAQKLIQVIQQYHLHDYDFANE